jgi:perosamine synthetase
MQGLTARGVGVRRGVMSAHLEAPYRHLWPAARLPVSTDCTQRSLILPLFPDMTEEDVAHVADALRDTLAECLHRRAVSCR